MAKDAEASACQEAKFRSARSHARPEELKPRARRPWSRRICLNAWTPINTSAQSFLAYADPRTVDKSLTLRGADYEALDHDETLNLQSRSGTESSSSSALFLYVL
jgi:hypothetical protein